ncbi:hypothetical protein RHGRI_016171 [Rhododendron griersonianum]|uniref:Uncharacterized protein n=1 Tax=Rhododendron griersonianum TaxID=479676 RepID=A0AAV6JTA2_9ERIC|nr:hypothetical protein RHGRI_016171 [Rhododendron griersonianum]
MCYNCACYLLGVVESLGLYQLQTLNISHFLYPQIREEYRPQPSPFLQDVLRAILVRQEWDSLRDVRVLELDGKNARFGSLERYEFRIRIGRKTELIFKLRDEVSLWKKMGKGEGDFESLVKEVSSIAVLDVFRVEGPLELIAGGDDELSLLLPGATGISTSLGLINIVTVAGNNMEVIQTEFLHFHHSSMAHHIANGVILVGEGITVEDSICRPLLPIHISGSVAVAAYRTRNPSSYIVTAFPLKDTIELLPEKCYAQNIYKKRRCPIDSLDLKITLMEKLLRSFLGNKIDQNTTSGFLKASIKASTVVRFKMELERDIRSNDTAQGTLAEWRTRPSVERVWFEIVARIEGERLKPLAIKKVRPFVDVDSSAWSNLMSNMSFTKFPSVLVPPEALTLDVKW